MSKINCDQAIDGILLVNKPQGPTSNYLLQQIRRLYRAKKAGHTGSLDPLATGMLPICFGQATKFSQFLLDSDKCYRATGKLGVKTSTGDALGEIIETVSSFQISKSELLEKIEQFKGTTKQIPSMFSALKHKGKPLYKYAREGIHIERPAREITIHELELKDFDGIFFTIELSCSKGTYVRNLVEDIGDSLGVGAHITQLERTSTAGFSKELMHKVEDLERKTESELRNCLLPIDYSLYHIPQLEIDEEALLALRQGKQRPRTGSKLLGNVRLYCKKEFVGLGELDNLGQLISKRLLAFKEI